MATQYWQKLQNPKWQKKRLEVLERAGFACESCGDSESQLHVHHNEYFKGREPWEYDKHQLSVLCESCHENRHNRVDPLKLICSFLPPDGPFCRDEIAMVIGGFTGTDYDALLKALDFEDCSYVRYRYEAGKKIRDQFEY